MKATSSVKTDRRDHLRVADSVYIEYRVLTREQVHGQATELPYQVSPRFLLLRDLYKLELEAGQLLRTLTTVDESLGAFLHTVNRRLEMMAKILANDELLEEARPAGDLDLSVDGVAFRTNELLQPGTLLGMKLLFHPSMLGLVMFGAVRYSRLAGDGEHYTVGVQFLHQDQLSRQLLVRHILRLQAEERRLRLLQDGLTDL